MKTALLIFALLWLIFPAWLILAGTYFAATGNPVLVEDGRLATLVGLSFVGTCASGMCFVIRHGPPR